MEYNGYTLNVYPLYFLGDVMKLKTAIIDFLYYILGSIAYSIAVIMFLSANKISPGGLTGIATLLNYLFSLPIGTVVFVLNIPILILGYFKFGKYFIIKTAISTLLVSVLLDIFEMVLPTPKIDLILASVFGGILMGLGISLIMLRGSTTGGIDIIAKFINLKFPHISIGKIMLTVDALVVGISSLVYKNTQSALYSVVSLYAASKIMDLLLYGADRGKIVYIISDKTQDIVSDIMTIVNRGVTLIDITGGFSRDKKQMIMCSVRVNEVAPLLKSCRKHDNNAFIVVSEAGEIIGNGFKK